MLDECKGPLRNSIDQVAKLLQHVHHAENEVFKLHGLCMQYHNIASITRLVQELIIWLEDVLCLVLLGFAELHSTYLSRELAYQAM